MAVMIPVFHPYLKSSHHDAPWHSSRSPNGGAAPSAGMGRMANTASVIWSNPGFAIQSVEDYNTNHVKKRSFIVYYSQGLYHSFLLAKAGDSAHELRPSRGVRTTSTWPAMSADL